MRHADCAALIIPSLPAYMRGSEIVGRLDGVLLTGTPSNVEPALYGDASEGEGPFDPDRDRMMTELVDAVIAARRPLFGICRGFQEINVALGGTLRRDTSASGDLLRHHAPDGVRSEEHTSELQSLMRISYAVFCLKKKKTTQHKRTYTIILEHNKSIYKNYQTSTHHKQKNIDTKTTTQK